MLHIFISNRPDKVRYGTTGWPVPGYEIALRGEDGAPVPDGEPATSIFRRLGGADVLGQSRQDARDLSGRLDNGGRQIHPQRHGTYTYAGRTDDMLKVSGVYVSPFEVEATLVGQHGSVLEAAVIAVADADGLTKPRLSSSCARARERARRRS